LWGGFRVNQATLSCFYSLHYLFPFVLIIFVGLHVLFLHETGSTSKLGDFSFVSKIKFHPYFTNKDIINLVIFFIFFVFVVWSPYFLGDSENFILANPIASPIHIKPEWYFL
jgi:ubiquinol-cytochrome c reductase cytochrome b subunit